MKRYISGVLALASAYFKRFLRDKTALFFTIMFPALFLIIFGSLNSGNDNISFKVAVVNNSDSAFAKEFVNQLQKNKTFDIRDDVTSISDGKELMGKGEIDSVIELPKNFGNTNDQNIPLGAVGVYYENSNPQGGQTIASFMQSILDGFNHKVTGYQPPLTVEQKATQTDNLKPFDYVFSGLLGFTLLSLGIFGLANSMPAEKKTGAFRRLRAAPIGASQLVLGNALAYLVMGLVSIAVMYVLALTVFDYQMQGDYFNFILFTILGIILMFGFGLAIGGWAKNEIQSAPLTQIVALPMMFLSGVFFPRYIMPEWLQSITSYLPLTPIVDGLRFILTEGKTLFDLGPQLAIMAVWTLIIYVIAFKVFRWE